MGARFTREVLTDRRAAERNPHIFCGGKRKDSYGTVVSCLRGGEGKSLFSFLLGAGGVLDDDGADDADDGAKLNGVRTLKNSLFIASYMKCANRSNLWIENIYIHL